MTTELVFQGMTFKELVDIGALQAGMRVHHEDGDIGIVLTAGYGVTTSTSVIWYDESESRRLLVAVEYFHDVVAVSKAPSFPENILDPNMHGEFIWTSESSDETVSENDEILQEIAYIEQKLEYLKSLLTK